MLGCAKIFPGEACLPGSHLAMNLAPFVQILTIYAAYNIHLNILNILQGKAAIFKNKFIRNKKFRISIFLNTRLNNC